MPTDKDIFDLTTVTPAVADAYYVYAGKDSGSLDKNVLLGSAAGHDHGDYATSAQGTLATNATPAPSGLAKPVAASFGTNIGSPSHVDGTYGIETTWATQGSNQIRGSYQAVLVGDWTITLGMKYWANDSEYHNMGLSLSDGTKYTTFGPDVDASSPYRRYISAAQFSNATSFASWQQSPVQWASGMSIFLRIVKVGTNRTFQYSFDGFNYTDAVTSQATYQTETLVGFGGNTNNSGSVYDAVTRRYMQTTIFHWENTTGTATNFRRAPYL